MIQARLNNGQDIDSNCIKLLCVGIFTFPDPCRGAFAAFIIAPWCPSRFTLYLVTRFGHKLSVISASSSNTMYQHESTWWLLLDTLWDTLLIETLQLWFCEAWRRVTPYDGPAWFQSDATIIIFSFSPTLSILSLKWITLGQYSDSGKNF